MLIGLIFPEKLCFDKSKSRTAIIISIVNLMYLIDRDLQGEKNEEKSPFSYGMGLVIQKSNHFEGDLELLDWLFKSL